MRKDESLKCKRLCNQVLSYIHQFICSQWVAVPLLTPTGTLYPHGGDCLQKVKRERFPFIKPRCSFRPPTTKEEMLTQCSFHLNAIPPLPFRASYYRWIILLVWTIAGRIGPASSAKSILHTLPAGIFFFFNLHALKNNPKLLITAALFTPFGWLLSTLCRLAVRLA